MNSAAHRSGDILLSVVLPIYAEQQHIEETVSTIRECVAEIDANVEFVLVDDGSPDGTWSVLDKMARDYGDVKAISFSRNFGKERAMLAGLQHCAGDVVVIMDSDLQHPPKLIPEMFELWKNNSELKVVNAVKTDRGTEGAFNRLASTLFYRIYRELIGTDLQDASDFKLLDREVVDTYKGLSERNLFFRGIVPWLGFESASVAFEVRERVAGETKWSTWQLFQLAMSAVTSFSTLPLQLVTVFGCAYFVVSVLLGFQTLWLWASGRAVEGFATVNILILMTGSVLMVSHGIIGQYLSKIYQEIKHRPHYLIRHRVGFDDD